MTPAHKDLAEQRRIWAEKKALYRANGTQNAEVIRLRAEVLRLTAALSDAQAEARRLQDLLCLADETIMRIHGCFPIDRTNERQIFLNDACRKIRSVTGEDYGARERGAVRAFLAAKGDDHE